MMLRIILLGAVICLFLFNQTSAQCLCASKGMDFCSCASATPPVRPVPKLVQRLATAKFPPIGDSCWCGKQTVEPAIPPKPTCKPPPTPGCKCSCSCSPGAKLPAKAAACLGSLGTPTAAAASAPLYGVPATSQVNLSYGPTAAAAAPIYGVPAASQVSLGYGPTAAPAAVLPTPVYGVPALSDVKLSYGAATAGLLAARAPGVPADPLSISMALTAGSKNFAVPEAKLSYGPVAAPVNGIQKIYYSNIPEEKLYALNAQIIEYKKKFPLPTKAELLAEAIEEAEEEQAAAVAAPAPYLSYSDLGYGPAIVQNPLFLRMRALAQPAFAAVGPRPLLTGCGYVPGKITQATDYAEQPLEYEAPCM